VPPETTSGAIELTVSDDGPVIDEALVPELFGRFVRADKARSRELNNSGLGLAIVASIAEAHGGTASVTSHSGATEFLVCLPAAERDDQHDIAKSYEPDMNSSTSPASVDMLDIR
jgi:two-component system, OmpR family, sensor histidine kinase TrcS